MTVKEVKPKISKTVVRPSDLLWAHLKGKQLDGLKFERDYPIDHECLDFFCPDLKLAIILDTNSHCTLADLRRDRAADLWLSQKGIEIIHFNQQAFRHWPRSVLHSILVAKDSRLNVD